MEWYGMKHKFEAIGMVNKNSDKAREKNQKKIINRIKRLIKGEVR
jgi:hypothetical protein